MTNEELKVTIESALNNRAKYQSALHFISNTLIANPDQQNLEVMYIPYGGAKSRPTSLLHILINEYCSVYQAIKVQSDKEKTDFETALNLSPEFKNINTSLSTALNVGLDLNAVGGLSDNTALYSAIGNNNTHLMKLLLSKGAKINFDAFQLATMYRGDNIKDILNKYVTPKMAQEFIKTAQHGETSQRLKSDLETAEGKLKTFAEKLKTLEAKPQESKDHEVQDQVPTTKNFQDIKAAKQDVRIAENRVEYITNEIEAFKKMDAFLQNLASSPKESEKVNADEVMKIFSGDFKPVAEKAVEQVEHQEAIINLDSFSDANSAEVAHAPAVQAAEPVAAEARDLFDGILSTFDPISSNIPASSSQQEAQVAGLDAAFADLADLFA